MASFAKFTESAQRALSLSQEEARRLGFNYVGTEHLLLGLLEEPNGAAGRALEQAGLTAESIEEIISQILGKGDFAFDESFDLTSRTKRVIELSIIEARNMQNNYVGTEHLLLALLNESEGVAARILRELGIDLQGVIQNLQGIMGDSIKDGGKKNAPTEDTKTLDQYSRDLTQMAKNGELDPVIGRATEIDRIIQILSRRTKNNPVLIGEPGVGKSVIVEGLAQRIVDGNVPELLKNKRLVSLDIPGMLAGAKFRGEFEERLKGVMQEIKKSGNVIVFIDEMHTLIGAGAAEGAIDAANILKPMLAKGELQTIGATTLDEYRKHVEKDPALERRFQQVLVSEPTQEEAIQILTGLRDKYEAHHKVRITDEAIRAAVNLSSRYISDRFLPDKAIDLMDEAASRVRLDCYTASPDMKQLEDKLETLRKEKEEAVANQNFERAAQIRDEEQKTKAEMEKTRKEWNDRLLSSEYQVGEDEIAKIVAAWTGVPVIKLTEDESQRLLNLEKILHNRVIGQTDAVDAVARAVRRARAGLKDPKRPIGSFIFLGPTGVGKTELSKALAEALFGDENAIIRIDMTEYMERHTVSRLIGAPPGYVGYDDGGQLSDKVRRKPYSVILFDEIEKAHPDVFNILLQILDDGRLTDSKGKTVDFKNTVIIMTSNLGTGALGRQKSLGFGSTTNEASEYEAMKDNVMDELKKSFRPEFLNRLDEIIVFHPLSAEDIRKIVELMLASLTKRTTENGITISVTDAAKDFLAKAGYDPIYGARPLKRTIQRLVEDKLSEEMLSGNIKSGDEVKLDVEDGKLAVRK